ncbi:MAG: carboxy-S-adenosyl-L-methionine synthase CmoA, partial [Woeseiaceae bacterium]
AVAQVFPDMLRRSIPGYAASLQAIGQLASRFAQPDSRCYDLGCSLGAVALTMRQAIAVPGCRIVAVDNSPAMIARCRENIANSPGRSAIDISVLEADIRDVSVTRASMVVLNYTLQFLPPGERGPLLKRIAAGTLERGILLLSEKVVDEDPEIERVLLELHHEYKRRNAYSELEISRKRAALEKVLVPDTLSTHLTRLREAGFRRAGVWLRYFNFASILAIR